MDKMTVAINADIDNQLAPPGVKTPQSAKVRGRTRFGIEDQPEDNYVAETVKPNAQQRPAIYTSEQDFNKLGLSVDLLNALFIDMKFDKPSKIQATTIPMILSSPNQHLVAQAHNGSGKTTCYVVAILQKINMDAKVPQAIIVCPTRELVEQNQKVLLTMGSYTDVKVTTTLQDLSELKDMLAGKRHIDSQVVIGTHGRLWSYIKKNLLPLDQISMLVFDEADEMLGLREDDRNNQAWRPPNQPASMWNQNFAQQSERLIKDIQSRTNNSTQILLFSATYNDNVKEYTQKVLPGANQVFVPKESLSLDAIKQYQVKIPDEQSKFDLLENIIFPNCDKLGQTIIFGRTRESVRLLKEKLQSCGHTVTSVSGEMTHEDRDIVTREFRNGLTRILITTNVLSRGFDVQEVTLVINYDIPTQRGGYLPDFETYLHRVGRSGRFGRKGAAFNLCCDHQDQELVRKIEDYFQINIRPVELSDERAFISALEKAGLSSGDALAL